jgi:ribosomal-protein-alanine N-acetyltransferase
MVIREATLADIPRLLALAEASETAAHWSAPQYEAIFTSDSPPRRLLVAVEGGARAVIIGFAVAHCIGDEWEVENIVVAAHCRRQGIAQQLMQLLTSRARFARATSIFLEVRESNLPARQLYAMLGFTECARRAGYYTNPLEDALVLRLELQYGDKSP